MELLIAVGFFGLVSAVVYFLVASKAPVSEEAIQRRLENIGIQAEARNQIRLYDTEETTLWERVADFFFGDKEMPDRFNKISRRLHQAGYRGNRAVRIFWGLRIFLCIAFAFGGLVGYMLPFLTVFRKARARVREMRETLPDTLDLIVVCVEAGMGVDAALNRVGKEQNAQNLALAEEVARKTVIKLIFPLVFFILPAIFIILLGPPGLGIVQMLSDPLR